MPTVVGGSTTPQKSDATKAWHHLLRNAFVKLPHSLAQSHEYRMKLRRLSRHH